MGLSDFALFVSRFRGAGGYSKRRTGVNPRLYWIAKIANRDLEDARITRIAERLNLAPAHSACLNENDRSFLLASNDFHNPLIDIRQHRIAEGVASGILPQCDGHTCNMQQTQIFAYHSVGILDGYHDQRLEAGADAGSYSGAPR